MSRYYRAIIFIVFSVFAAVIFVGHSSPARAQGPNGPDFSSVTDLLQGRRTLFPSDDIVVSSSQFIGAGTTTYILPTSGGTISSTIAYPINNAPQTNAVVTSVSRMFNLPRDVVVTVVPGITNLIDQGSGFNQNFPNTVSRFPFVTHLTHHVSADLTGDGYADLAFISTPTNDSAELDMLTATNVMSMSQGFLYGTPLSLPGAAVGGVLASADFNGDGTNELALAYQGTGVITIVLYEPQVTTDHNGNVTGLSLKQLVSTNINAQTDAFKPIALVAGNFSGLANPQLILTYSTGGNQTYIQPIAVGVTSNNPMLFTLTLANLTTLNQSGDLWITARANYLDYFENTEQLVLMLQVGDHQTINIVTFDSQLNGTLASSFAPPQNGDVGRLNFELGNFDQAETDSSPLNLQIAALWEPGSAPCGGQGNLAVQIYSIDPGNNFAITPGNSYFVDTACAGPNGLIITDMATGDTQGKSIFLGAPSKLTATKHKQPQIVLGAPPMHVDYATPANANNPVVLNVSAVPNGFYSSYQTAVTNQAQSSHQGTTSYANGVKVSADIGFKIGDPLVGSISAKVGANAGKLNSHFVKKQYGTYLSTSFDASTSTGFDDQIWYSSETHNIFIYPIIGQTACPAETPNCTPSQKSPMVIMFSGPSSQQSQSVGGSALEWYQPVHEVGNLFSYPWNLQQLQNQEGDIALLTSNSPTSFSTDSSTHTATATWSGQGSNSVTSGNVHNVQWGANASVTEKAGIFGGIVGNQKFSYNGSKSQQHLNTSTTTMGQSTGIGIVKPGTFPNPGEYQYPIFPYIFGETPLSGTVQSIPLSATIQSYGVLHAAFTSNPTDGTAGAWWQSTYTMPDVAVAHSNRWNFQIYTPSSPQTNCIPLAVNLRNNDCAQFNAPQTASNKIWTSEFFWMKGLLITPADANGEGPQITQATAGDRIQLQARVYNDSLADMPNGSQIVVQFYGQPWSESTEQPNGNAFLIDTVDAPRLPGYNSILSGGTIPNYEMVSTTNLNTAAYPDTYLVFWVVVYMDDGQGHLVPEMPAHGLTSVPPTLNSITAIGPYLQHYSNNVGLYKQMFYINPPNPGNVLNPKIPSLKMDKVQLSQSQVLLGTKVTISGLFRSKNIADALDVLFYDAKGKKNQLFDEDQITHIRANGSALVKTVYRATSCGAHTLSLLEPASRVTAKATLTVTIDPLPVVTQLKQIIQPLKLDDQQFGQLLNQAEQAFKGKQNQVGLARLARFQANVKAQPNQKISADTKALINALLKRISNCVQP